MQTNLKSDDFCGYNQESAPFFWIFQKGQYANTYAIGEIGIAVNAGAAGSYIRPEIIDISSNLSGRESILTKCAPPVPSLDSLNEPELHMQNETNSQLLLPMYTKEKRSSVELDSVDYNRWSPLYSEPQNLRHVIDETAPQRGGFDTRSFVKLSWNPSVSGKASTTEKFDNSLCQINLDPARFGNGNESVTGYPGNDILTGVPKNTKYVEPGFPKNDPKYPFRGVTSQQIASVGGETCGNTFFSGDKYNVGSCPKVNPIMLNDDAMTFNYL